MSVATAEEGTLDQCLIFQEVSLLSAVVQLVLQFRFLLVCDVNSTPLLDLGGTELFRAKRI
jgi:hypothetical protein